MNDEPINLDNPTLTIEETARVLSTTPRSIYRMSARGDLPLEFRHVGKRRVVLTRSVKKFLGL